MLFIIILFFFFKCLPCKLSIVLINYAGLGEVTANRVLHFMRKMQSGAQKLFCVSSEGSQLLYINYCRNFNSVIDWNILQGRRKPPTLRS